MKPEDLEILTAPTAALEKVRHAMSIPPEPGLPVTFLRQAPQTMGPPMSAQEQQQMMQRAQLQQQAAQLQRSQMQAQSQLKRAEGVPVPPGAPGAASPMYPQQPGARPQVRRMASNNNGQAQLTVARPSQSPGPGMPTHANQQPLQQSAQLAAQQLNNAQAVQFAQQRLQAQQQNGAQMQNNATQQALQQAMMAVRQQQQQQQRAGQFAPNGTAMPLQNNGAAMPPPAQPRSASGNVQQLPNGDGMQMDSPRSNGRTPAAGHLQLPPGQVPLQADGSVANGVQRSPRQPLAQPNPMPNTYGMSVNFDQQGPNNTQLNPQLSSQQMEKVRALLAGKSNGTPFNLASGVPNGTPPNGFPNGATPDNMPMKLTLPPARQNQLRAGGSPVNAQ